MSELKKKINYFVVCVNEFSKKYNLPPTEAFHYLYKYKAIEFLKEHYDIEHTLSFSDVLEDMTLICRKNGGVHL